MSANKNVEEREATLGGVLFLGALMALLGAFGGFMFLASVSPKSYKSVEELQAYLEKTSEPNLLEASYFEGPVSRSRSWELKRDELFSGSATTVELTSGEINAWMASKFRQSKPASNDEEAPNIVILPGAPNFFIDANLGFFLNLPTDVSIYGSDYNWLVVAQGHFSDGPWVEFQVDALHVNDAGIPVVGGVADRFVGALLQAYSETEEFIAIQKAWTRVESVELVEDMIRLKLR
ncbi:MULTISPECIES: hypothetical protein [unclassified Lentimonas]|uniref:hypothetical protein n=1 Tax=unclassified Lentimonas TaxID=2630993 RepID=UPI00132BECE3|nr:MULTISPECIES: hypothetical protein [unclassified Lentimonas]CAA6679585.1 Unannotated [Lentimonas sp. CC4]CAA6687303.1 Unannotated [Lentimonas sp. CC6]CAA6696790.1 Unannotated [Lentimonas sp. CC19]CAA6697416.1 Unannotated [Lentimonas sp. CC10]CAA7071345.1 Unannotated [Lentimonas sp. CC11]